MNRAHARHPRSTSPINFVALFRSDPRTLAFGLLHTFSSSVGQTFFISLFLPEIKRTFELGDAAIAGLFAVATVSSAAVLWRIGPIIDRMDVIRYSIASGLFLAGACLLMAGTTIVPVLLLGLFCLRLGGQGLLTHVAVTAIARYFTAARGTALSLTLLGHALGEALLPALVVAAIAYWGWRMTFVAAGVFVAVLVLGACALVRRQRAFRRPDPVVAPARSAGSQRPGTEVQFLRTRYFRWTLPLFIGTSMITTALIFHQALIAVASGMSLQWFAVSFTGFAIAKVVSSLLVGPLIDRYGATHLFTFHLVPMLLGIVVLVIATSPVASLIYWMLLGVSSGMAGALHATILATHVPRNALGAARSVLASIGIVASAAGPALYGLVLAASVPWTGLLWGTVGALVGATWLGVSAERNAKRGGASVP